MLFRSRRSTSQWLGVQVPWQGDTLYVNAMFTRMLYPNGQTGHARTLAVAYNHPLSKRTSVYGSYGWVANDERGLTPLYGAVPAFLPAKAGDDIRGLVFGLKTAF